MLCETVEINDVAEVSPDVADETVPTVVERTPEVACDVDVETLFETFDELVVPQVFADVDAEISVEVSSRE